MSGYRVNWQGSFPAIVTPFDKDGAINDKLLRENVRMTLGEGAHGIVAAGHFGGKGGDLHDSSLDLRAIVFLN